VAKLDDFIVCEDVRLEVSGLMTLVGFFAAALRIPTAGNLKLSFVMVMSEMKGCDRFLLMIETRLGKDVLTKSGVMECKRDPTVDSHTIVHTINPFPAPRAGRYELRVTVEAAENQTFTRGVTIDIGPQPPSGK
jgi:hypothetical protein